MVVSALGKPFLFRWKSTLWELINSEKVDTALWILGECIQFNDKFGLEKVLFRDKKCLVLKWEALLCLRDVYIVDTGGNYLKMFL